MNSIFLIPSITVLVVEYESQSQTKQERCMPAYLMNATITYMQNKYR
jgi:hypothetical protein